MKNGATTPAAASRFGKRASRPVPSAAAVIELAALRHRRRPFRLPSWIGALAAFLLVFAAVSVFLVRNDNESAAPTEAAHSAIAPSENLSANFSLCHSGGGTNCVVDGDTFWFHGEKIRIADIDAPETHPSRCAREADLGNRATYRLQALLNAGPIELAAIDRDEDVYERKLRVVRRGGQSLGLMLVSEGLARRWNGGRQPWC